MNKIGEALFKISVALFITALVGVCFFNDLVIAHGFMNITGFLLYTTGLPVVGYLLTLAGKKKNPK